MEHFDVYKPLNDDISNDVIQKIRKLDLATVQKWTYETKLGKFLPTPKPN